MSENLDELRKIAEAATPGPWTLEYENSDDWEAGINDGDYPHTIHGPRNCSFDNWTDKSKIQDYLNRVTEISEMVDEDAEFIATFDPPTVLGLITRLEQAEQAAARVREVATGDPTEYGWSEAMLAILRALDGHTKQLGGTPTGEFADVCSCGKSYWPCTALDGEQK